MNSAPPSSEPSPAVALFGTEEPAPPLRVLTAGELSVEFDSGNLRHIRYCGVEILRAISFIVRDRNWGTYSPLIENLTVDEEDGGFHVAYDAVARDDVQAFRYRARIEGRADGSIAFEARGFADTDFLTNRTGFVVLHPIAGVSGQPATIEHVDGGIVEGRFPDLIDPVQPMMDLRSLTHEAAPGLKVVCRMEGDSFEMEDQRNWADASYKTYVRPLARPWPYILPKGSTMDQAVRLSVSGPRPTRMTAPPATSLGLGAALGPAPSLGLGLDPDEVEPTRRHAERLRAVGARIAVCHYDPRRGHNRETLAALASAAALVGLEPRLEAVVVSVDDFEREIAELGRMVETLGSPFSAVLVSPAPDLKCTLPGSPWPPAPAPEALFAAARAAFPKAKLGGGMFSLFTEMNRKRPPTHLLDFVSFTTTATMHAGDDYSVIEGLEALPAIAKSARAIAGRVPYAVGPSAIGMRMNPYGEAPMANPGNIRQAMNFNDPRHRGMLGAAWALGFFNAFARGGAEAITLGGLTGPFGLIHTPRPWPQPWFDDHGGLFPMFHVLRGLAGLAGKTMRAVETSDPTRIAALAVEDTRGVELWAANLTREPQTIAPPAAVAGSSMLAPGNFVEATRDPQFMERLTKPPAHALELPPFGVARLILT
jgi:hypothetical protein